MTDFSLPKVPLTSIAWVRYFDAAGAEIELSPAAYLSDRDGRLMPAGGAAWPATQARITAVRVRFIAGMSPEDVPENLREAILQLAAWWYEQRETATIDGTPASVPFSVDDLIAAEREWTF